MGYEIRQVSKEELVYSEGGHGFAFDHVAAVVYIPSAGYWDAATPKWMHGRRGEIVARLAAWIEGRQSRLQETDRGYTATASPGRPWVSAFGLAHDRWLAILMDPTEHGPPEGGPANPEWSQFIQHHHNRIGEGTDWQTAAQDLKRRLDTQGIFEVNWGGLLRPASPQEPE